MNNISKNNSVLFYWIIISISVIVGIYIRLNGLGTWPLALDEYYVIKSAENILKYGLPQFPNGGYYERGILMQYIVASLIAFGIKAEFAGRIFTVISNLIAIPAVYLIAKRIGNHLIAILAVVIFCFSVWEIEFARFARMYAPFQTIFVWYIYFALKDYEDKDYSSYNWLLVFSATSILIYEGSIFLAILNFVPLALKRKFNLKYLIASILVFVFSLFYNLYSFKTLNSSPLFPPEYLNEISKNLTNSPIKLPQVLLPFSFQTKYFSIISPIIISISIFLIALIIKNLLEKNFYSISAVIFLGACIIFNQFGLFLLSLLIFIYWRFLDPEMINKKSLVLIIFLLAINLIYWYTYGILSTEWYVLFDDFSSYSMWGVTKRLFVGFFNFPDNYTYLHNYFKTLPILTLSAGLLFSILLVILLFSKVKNEKVRFLTGIIIFMGLVATSPAILYVETRYTFFLVPILLIVLLYAVYFLLNKLLSKHSFVIISFSSLILIGFIFSEDFNFYHLFNIEKQNINYRMIYNDHYKRHLYRRWDIKTPTDFVKKHLGEKDVIMINENSSEYYLPRVDYFNFDYRHRAFVALTVEKGKKERWSNAKLIYKNDDLINFIENRNNTIWYLVYPENWLKEINFYERYKEFLVYQGVDEMIKVFRFPASK